MKFDSAFSYFEKSTGIDPRYLVSLFPKLLPYQTSFRQQHQQQQQQSQQQQSSTSSPPQQQENLQELIDANVDVEDRLERMREAKLCLLAYLEKRFGNLKHNSDEQKDISTVLIKLYAELNEQNKAIAHLAKLVPFYLQDIEEWLSAEKYYSTLGYVYQFSENSMSSPATGMSPATASPTLGQRASVSLTSSSSSLNPASASPRTQQSFRHSMILGNQSPNILSSSPGQNIHTGSSNFELNPSQIPTNVTSPDIKSSLYDPKRTELFLCLLKTYLSKSSKQLIDNFNQSSSSTSTNNNNNNNNNVELPNYLIEFLNKYYNEMDPIKVMSLLPSNTLLSSLEYYLSMSFNHSISSQRETKIVKNLQRSQNLNIKIEHQTVCSGSIHMGLDRNCPVCNKQIGDKVFAYFPNGVITHFKCFQSTHICPVTAKNFKKNPTDPIST
ncbi:prespore-specific protein [Cavenderia fasciculata]|uniref:Prespore-specific protein n=1 Tax=Cavenderia fasciculata TaxID=261658 RepID=F4PH44_CACFS|nr:prespore-specific protein [Cavenderia fasciculata]EGG25028.1 prespore-specific protein [Cavenderia fasciculata]|eukprot:XP_004362879.1 prespore-specific protein [Cavenderia fasciculata]